MKDLDYLKTSLSKGISVRQLLEEECENVLSYHSYSPQYGFYKERFNDSLNSCLYKGLIDFHYHESLNSRIKAKKDTDSLGLASPILTLLSRYKPRLKLIDLLYDIDLERTYILKVACDSMHKVFTEVNGFSTLFEDRQALLLSLIEKALSHSDDPSRKCYYYLNLAKNVLLVLTKYYRTGECDSLVDLYIDVSNSIYKSDEDFFKDYVEYYKLKEIDDSNVFSVDTDSDYSYMDYLYDYNKVLKSLSSSSNVPITSECDAKLMNSKLPDYLKNYCSKDIYNLEIFYSTESTEVSSAFIWYDVVREDFIYFLNARLYEEAKIIVRTLSNLLKEEGLVEFYVNKAMMTSLPDDGDELTYNVALIESLENLESYGFINDVSYYFNLYRR